MNLSDFFRSLHDKSVTVIGLAVSNTPLINMLLDAGIHVHARDIRSPSQFGDDLPFKSRNNISFSLGPHYLHDLSENLIFRTPGLNPNLPEIQLALSRGSILSSEMETFFMLCPCPIIAVTGSDGKTTTASLIADILSRAGYSVHLGGNIGTPLLPRIPLIQPNHYAVIELSSFQLMTMNSSPHIAVITNISPNHLDYHSDMNEYVLAKSNIFLHQSSNDLLVLNRDNPFSASISNNAAANLRFFSRRIPSELYFDGNNISFLDKDEYAFIAAKSEIALPGLHNIENLMAAFAAVFDITGPIPCRLSALNFSGVQHRIEFVRSFNGVSFFNDSIASSPSRSIAALLSFDNKLILIAGGYDKNIPYDSLGPIIRETVKTLVLTGATAPKIRAAVENASGGSLPDIIELPDFYDAVLYAVNAASPGDTVLLSPASASFDQFKNFEERGNLFKSIISQL